MQNTHRHTSYSNISTPDSAATNEDYAKRAVELGHKILSSVEHGWQGNYFEVYELAKKYNLKCVIGAEAYWVKDRQKEYPTGSFDKDNKEITAKDKNNNHILILAKNNNGREVMNDILSEANITGYYYKPRVDLELLLSLPADDVVITTACIAFNGYGFEESDEIIEKLHNHFKDNFYLEIQYHNTEKQKMWNLHLKELSNKFGIELIVGLDSHYCKEDEGWQRDYILDAKGLHYEDEDGWYMDYPDDETVINRFLEQNVFTKEEIQKAMDNTDITLTFEDYDDVYIFSKEIKLPTLFVGESEEEKNKRYSKLITKKFKEYTKDFAQEEYDKYLEGVKMEVDTYRDTGMVDYPLIDYAIVKDAKEHGGLVTDTGRGCFTKDALVHTKSGLKNICDVQINDYVIDMNGCFKKVINTMKYHVKEDLIKISYLYGDNSKYPNMCTKDHKIYIHRDGVNQWIEAQNIMLNDYVCLPKVKDINNGINVIDLNEYNIYGYDFDNNYIYEYSPFINNEYSYSPRELSRVFKVNKKTMEDFANGYKNDFPRKPGLLDKILKYIPFNSVEEYREYIKNMRTIKIHRYVNIDYEFGQFVGLMYGDGCNSLDRNEISLAVNKCSAKDKINRKIFENIANTFGIKSYCKSAKNRNLNQLGLRSKLISNFISNFLFTSQLNKEKIFNDKLFDYNNDFKKGILNGLFLSDGSNSERKSFDNTSMSLINAFKILSLMTCDMGIMNLTVRNGGIDNRGYNRKQSYKLRYASNPYKAKKICERCLNDDKYWYLPIKKIETISDIETDVYDLTVENSHSYLINNMIVHNSAVGYFTNTLCGFSNVDRFKAAVKLYPERFISTTRILETHSLPDIDLNTGTPEILEESQIRILGQEHVYPMIAFGTLKKKSAFKMYARAKNMDFELANKISKQIDKYEEDLKHAEDDERDTIDVYDYVDKEYHSYLDQSQEYWGIISDKKKAPSAYLLYQGDIRKEIGLIKCKSESSKKEYITCVINGAVAENYKFLKNDILKVDVVLLIDKVFKRIGIEHFDVPTLIDKLKDDKATWDIYANGYTIGVNQVEKQGSRHKCMRYKPQNLSELSAFVAAIRPGFKSMYNKFESREDFSYGIDVLDNMLKTEELSQPFIYFQEQCMAVLNYAGFPMDQCYGIIKAIAKKHPEKVKPLKAQFLEGFKKQVMIDEDINEEKASEYADIVWTVVNDNCGYSFNASHAYCMALDSSYQAWQKAHYPYEFYEVNLQHFTDKGKKDKVVELKTEMKKAFGINEGEYKFRRDNRKFTADPENHCINPMLSSIKNIGKNLSEKLYDNRDKEYDSFIDLLIDFKELKIGDARDLDILIKIGYFSEFGEINQLLKQVVLFNNLYGKKQIKLEKTNIPMYMIEKYADKVTEKTAKFTDMTPMLRELVSITEYPKTTVKDRLTYQSEHLGYISEIVPNCKEEYWFVLDITGYSNNVLKLHNIKTGKNMDIKYQKKGNDIPHKNDIINVIDIAKRGKYYKDENDEWQQDRNNLEKVLKSFLILT